jgi:hypothetical protein
MANHIPMQGTLDFEAAIRGLRNEAVRALKAARQLARTDDPLTPDAFEDAERASDLAADGELQVQVRESFASYLKNHEHFRSAKERLVRAEQIAQAHGFDEDAARLQVSVEEMKVELAQDTTMKDCLLNFGSAAGEGSYSWQDKRDALFGFIADLARAGGRLAARGIGSIADFRDRLDSARRGRGGD